MKKLITLIAVISAVLFITSCNKDDDTEAWIRGANCLIRTNDGNLMSAGFTLLSGMGFQGLLTKTDNDGNILWSYSYGTTNSDGFFSVANTADGGYVATGYTYASNDPGTPRLILVRVNASGNQEWMTILTDYAVSQGISVVPAIDNGFVVCGYMRESSSGDRNILLVKFSPEGKKEWAKSYGGKSTSTNNYDEAYDLIAADNGYYITGSVNGYSNCCGNAFLMRTNASGDTLWNKTYSGTMGYSIEKTSDNGFIVGGSATSDTDLDFYLLKTNSEGTLIWEKQFPRSGYDYGTAVIPTADGGFALTGNSNVDGNLQISLLKVDANGENIWKKTYGGNNVEYGYGLIQNNDGSYNLAGLSNTGGSFVYLNKTTSDGTLVWEKKLK